MMRTDLPNPSTQTRMKIGTLVILCEASLLTLWLVNGEQWSKAILLSWLWTIEAGYIISLALLMFFAQFVPVPPPSADKRAKWFRHAVLLWNLCMGAVLILVAKHPLLGCAVILAITLSRVDRHFRSEA